MNLVEQVADRITVLNFGPPYCRRSSGAVSKDAYVKNLN